MKTRTREHGTLDIYPKTSEERIEAFRAIIAAGQYAKIDGTMIDLFSANVVVQVYDALNETNKARFSGSPAGKMAQIAFKLAAR